MSGPDTNHYCPAHGENACRLCARTADGGLVDPTAFPECRGCGYYGGTGMHWDTCQYRVRTPLEDAPQDRDGKRVDAVCMFCGRDFQTDPLHPDCKPNPRPEPVVKAEALREALSHHYLSFDDREQWAEWIRQRADAYDPPRPAEPSLKGYVLDKNGYVWQRLSDGWSMTGCPEIYTWSRLLDVHGPVDVLSGGADG